MLKINNKLKFIVTGTGRCGTVFFAKMLTGIGIPCGHESIFDYSSDQDIISRLVHTGKRTLSICSQKNNFIEKKSESNWISPGTIVADSSYLAAPYLNHPLICDVPVIHLFRDPYEVISSYVLDFNYFKDKFPNNNNPYNRYGWENKIYEHLPEISLMDSQIERACWFYFRWNRIIKESSRFRRYLPIKIDSINYEKLFEFLNISDVDKSKLFNCTNTNSNRKRKKNLDEFDIANKLLRDLINEIYGSTV